jgi:4'-phosphopantetheinyl transferase EntD
MTNNSARVTLNPLYGLLPADIATAFSTKLPVEASLLGVETELAQKMAEKRYNEFIHGRHCARLALAQLGIAPGPIDKGPNREPLWPESISGTISHTLHYAAAAVAPSRAYRGIGLDMESATPLEDKLFKAICREEELQEFARLKLTAEAAGERAKLLFSIKESIYKCLWPCVRQFIDFTEMQVELETDGFSYRAIPHTQKVSAELVSQLQGRYRYDGELILSSAWLSTT